MMIRMSNTERTITNTGQLLWRKSVINLNSWLRIKKKKNLNSWFATGAVQQKQQRIKYQVCQFRAESSQPKSIWSWFQSVIVIKGLKVSKGINGSINKNASLHFKVRTECTITSPQEGSNASQTNLIPASFMSRGNKHFVKVIFC